LYSDELIVELERIGTADIAISSAPPGDIKHSPIGGDYTVERCVRGRLMAALHNSSEQIRTA